MLLAPFRYLVFMFFVCATGFRFAQGENATKTAKNIPSFVYVRDNKPINIENLTAEEAKNISRSFPGEFIWYRENGKVYLIMDKVVISNLNRSQNQLITLITTRPPAVSSSQAEAGMKAVREHTRMLRDKIMSLKETVHTLLRDAIRDGLATSIQPPPADL